MQKIWVAGGEKWTGQVLSLLPRLGVEDQEVVTLFQIEERLRSGKAADAVIAPRLMTPVSFEDMLRLVRAASPPMRLIVICENDWEKLTADELGADHAVFTGDIGKRLPAIFKTVNAKA